METSIQAASLLSSYKLEDIDQAKTWMIAKPLSLSDCDGLTMKILEMEI